MENLLNRLKERLNEKEYQALKKASEEIKNSHVPSRFDVCFACRYDIPLAYTIVNTLRMNITDPLSLCEYVASVKTLYLSDRNSRQKAECSYSVEGDSLLVKQSLLTATANTHLLIKLANEKDTLTLCKAIKLFDDLKFLASEVKADKTVYESFKQQCENALANVDTPLSKKLVSGYLSLLSLEQADTLVNDFDTIFSAIKLTKNNTSEIVFWSEKGLDVYGYNEQCEKMREWAIDRYLACDTRFNASIISEIIINN